VSGGSAWLPAALVDRGVEYISSHRSFAGRPKHGRHATARLSPTRWRGGSAVGLDRIGAAAGEIRNRRDGTLAVVLSAVTLALLPGAIARFRRLLGTT
jgi:hypothetical protein